MSGRVKGQRLRALALAFGVVSASPRVLAETAPPLAPPPLPAAVETPPELPPLEWRWRRFSAVDYAVTLAGGGVMLGAAIIKPVPTHSLQGPVLFDASVRNALRAPSLQVRYTYRDASDVGVSLAVSWPFFADALTTAWWYRGNRDVAEQMALIDLEAFAVIGAIQGVTNVAVSRERPFGPQCGSAELPANSDDCAGSGRYRSFFSGHTSMSFTGAALICVHHFQHELLGSPWDALSCAGGYAVAASTGMFRLVGDVHYATDVLTGMLAGTLVGYGVPFLHYAFPAPGSAGDHAVQLTLAPAPGGASVVGIF